MPNESELEQLRRQVEEYRLRELADLREQLAEQKALVAHYRSEAQRNADLGRQIDAQYREEVALLRSKLALTTELQSVRQPRPTS